MVKTNEVHLKLLELWNFWTMFFCDVEMCSEHGMRREEDQGFKRGNRLKFQTQI